MRRGETVETGWRRSCVGFSSMNGTRDPAPAWLEGVRARLARECSAPPSRSELAAVAGVEPSHVSRAFRLHYGMTMTSFAREHRVAEALTLLANTGWTVEEVARAAGFSDQGHLAREVRRKTGMTPAAWRRATWARARSLRGTDRDALAS